MENSSDVFEHSSQVAWRVGKYIDRVCRVERDRRETQHTTGYEPFEREVDLAYWLVCRQSLQGPSQVKIPPLLALTLH